MNWYRHSKEEVFEYLGTSVEKGLTDKEVEKRLEIYSANELQEEPKRGFVVKIIDQFSDFLVIILIFAALISIIIGEARDSIVILAVVILNAILGIYQEGKAEKALEALKRMSSPTAKVIRNGYIDVVPAANLVPGDAVILEAGDIIPADMRLVESSNLTIDEASLTGESVPVEKKCGAIIEEDVSLGDRENMAYMSTIVAYGRGKGIVTETGHNTEIGKIATQIQSLDEDLTPLQKKLNQLGKYLGIITIIVCVIVFGIGILQGRGILEMFMVAISLAVAAIPEGLPAIVTIVLALGMNKMVGRNAIVKKLLAVETLGSITVICSDKTGTLTQNEMTVVKIFTNNKVIDVTGVGYESSGKFKIGGKEIVVEEIQDLKTLLSIGVLANDANITNISGTVSILGNPTEGALLTLGKKGNIDKDKFNREYPRIQEMPFDSNRKMMTTFHQNYIAEKIVSFTKGAPDIVVNRCKYISINGEVLPLNDSLRKKVLDTNDYFAKDALRVLALAYKTYAKLPDEISTENTEQHMILVGLVGIIDPPRPEAKEAIVKCKEAGITPIMITGDYKETAFAISKELGIAESSDEAIMGEELDKISDMELRKIVEKTKVYSRVSPEHKVRIVSALKAKGEIVAMTGDGVNDSMALKKADIGISMGITGTDVAKNTAEVILTDDNFASIVSAVEEGRIIFRNIRKFVFFLLSCNIGEIIIVFTSILLNLPIPLLPIQLLWLNLVTDSFPALALGVEKGEEDIMKLKPRNPDTPIIDNSMMIDIIVQSIVIGATSLLAYIWGLNTFPGNLIKARTITFTTLILAELLRAYSSRSDKYILFEIGVFSNPTMVYGTTISFLLMLGVIYIPVLQSIFHTIPLEINDWGVISSFALLPLIIGELYKVIFNRKNKI
ncbi:calcium-translocating P-type ATPase, SERCA-type [Tissierella sp. Yu-01]|uniref:calcium-translocating P-type ATPase, SERCA-type n=1 Tax=Tissierella sp. Yu-01 TaxID=3035694 RepID=UPI00240E50E3|nr:calcium-translocating P-type ATPase, SERCA-type [Tissierella sp. Yu-01]WFA09613.1 calcium-translocating P-type ATPase, SERCA-type [Tissierella sp. Yu-01]